MALSGDQLDLLDRTKEVRVETFSSSGSTKTIIWIVVEAGVVYVRSVRGERGHWYQRVMSNPLLVIHANGERIEFRAVHVDDPDEIEAVSSALRDKYPPGGSLDRMTDAGVLNTTLRLEPT
jgi:hypothetical protein